MGFGDELREVIVGVAEAIRGGRKVVRAAGAVADRLDLVLDRVIDGPLEEPTPEPTLGGGPPGKCLGIACDRHGNQRWAVWRRTVVCGAEGCGRIYQMANANGRHFAPPVCACGARLRPPAVADGKPYSAKPLCSPCFDEIAATSGRAVRRGPMGGAP